MSEPDNTTERGEQNGTDDAGVGRCDADGPVTRERANGPVMSRLICDRQAGHDGPHESGGIEWGGGGDE